MGHLRRLDLRGRDVDARGLDDVLDSSDEMQQSRFVDAGAVAGVEEPFGVEAVTPRYLIIRPHHAAAPNDQLALGVRWQGRSGVGLDDLHLQSWHRSTVRAGTYRQRIVEA